MRSSWNPIVSRQAAFRRASADANVSSMHDGAIVSAILALLFAAVILVAGLWSAAAGTALWLYRRSRQPVKRQVSSLRFWVSDSAPPPSRRLLREPSALIGLPDPRSARVVAESSARQAASARSMTTWIAHGSG